MRLRVIHVSRYAPDMPSLWVDTSEEKPILKAYVNGRYQTLSEEIPAGILTEDMIVNSLDSEAVNLPLSAAQGKALKALIDSIDVSEDIKEAINALDVSEVSAETGKIISSVSQTDGKISVKTRDIVEDDIPQLPQSKVTGLSEHISSTENPHSVTKEQVGLGNVDNTSDANKPVSTAQQAALDLKQDKLKAGTGIDITPENTVNVTLDTTVFFVAESTPESPTDEQKKKICLVPASTTEEGNYYTEYVWVVNEEHPDGYWEEFSTYKSEVDLTSYLKKVDAEATYQKITDDTLATAAKTIVGAINEVHTDLESAVQPYVVDLTSLLAAQDSESISTAIGGIDNLNGAVQKNQVIFGTLANGTVAVGIRVLGNQTTLTYFVDSLVGLIVNEVIITNTSGTLTKTANTHAVITENMVIDSLDSDEATLPLSAAQGKALNEKIQNSASTAALHKIYETYGAVYNDDTGYWEYGDLKDMTEEDCFLAAFYALEQIQGDNQVSFILDRYNNLSARTYFTKITPKGAQNDTLLVLDSCFAQNNKLEYLKLSDTPTSKFLYIKNMQNMVKNSRKLKKIEDILTIATGRNMDVEYAFNGCSALKDVKIRLRTGANVNISFEDSRLLSYESIKYLVDNAANTADITVTVHPTTYSYLTGTAQPTEEVGGTTEEWQALVTTAQGKQISFA